MHNSKMKLRTDFSLEEDPYMPDLAFGDHVGKNTEAVPYGNCEQNASFHRFRRIASALEMEEFDTFFDTSEEVGEFSLSSPDSGVHDLNQLDPESRAKAEEEWTKELQRTEEEINTLRQVLSSKIRRMQELKRKLGITVWKEFKDDMEQGMRNIQESTVYQKSFQTFKSASEKTTEALGTIGASITKKFEEVKQSPTFKVIEEKVDNAYTSVKTKVSGTNGTGIGKQAGEPPLIEKNGTENPTEMP